MTLEENLQKHALSTPDKCAVVCGNKSVSYSQLWESIQKRAEQLRNSGLEKHRPYVFRASQDADFIATYCAVHLLQAIAVPLEHAVPDEVFNKVKNEVESCNFTPDIVDILYTTGSTGKAKGVMLSQVCLDACADNFISEMNFHPDLVFIVSGPLNHIASLFKIHPILTVGGTLCVLDGLKDINAFFEVFNLPYRHFATFLVPASIRLLLQFSSEQLHKVSNLVDFIETGAAPISSADMQRLSKALPQSRLYNTLGGTEIGCVCTYQFNDGKYMEGCVGRPMRNASLEIAPDGSFIISGKTIMTAEPKFVPENAVTIRVGDNTELSVRLVDCVGYMVEGAAGQFEDGHERMVTTPWFDHEVTITEAAEKRLKRALEQFYLSEFETMKATMFANGELTEEQIERGAATHFRTPY